jgi:protein-S-isoprenylcysteine O-methyltransferase
VIVAALAILALQLLWEAVLRRGRAKRVAIEASDRGTTLLTTALPLLVLAAALPARIWLEPGRVTPMGAAGWGLVGVMLAGSALRAWSMRSLGEFFTRTLVTFHDHRLVERGPYRWVRNPGYLAQLLVVVPAVAILSANALYLGAFALIYVEIYRRRIAAEERMLCARFGEEFERYRRRTWRLVPFLY